MLYIDYHTRDFRRKQSNRKTGQLVASGQLVGLFWSVSRAGQSGCLISHVGWIGIIITSGESGRLILYVMLSQVKPIVQTGVMR